MTIDGIKKVLENLEYTEENEYTFGANKIEYETFKDGIFVLIQQRKNLDTGNLECGFTYGKNKYTYNVGTAEFEILSNFVLTLDSNLGDT